MSNSQTISNNQNSPSQRLGDNGVIVESPKLNSTRVRKLSRNGANKLHQEPEASINSNVVEKAVKAANLLSEGASEATGNIARSGFHRVKDLTKAFFTDEPLDAKAQNIKKIAIGIITAFTGVFTLKNGVRLTEGLFSGAARKQHSPSIFLGAKVLAGSALFTGMLNMLRGAKGGFASMKSVAYGLAGYGTLSGITSTYENPNSVISKLLNLFGLRGTLTNVMDQASLSRERNVKEALGGNPYPQQPMNTSNLNNQA